MEDVPCRRYSECDQRIRDDIQSYELVIRLEQRGVRLSHHTQHKRIDHPERNWPKDQKEERGREREGMREQNQQFEHGICREMIEEYVVCECVCVCVCVWVWERVCVIVCTLDVWKMYVKLNVWRVRTIVFQ
jgi:hypothetical protein